MGDETTRPSNIVFKDKLLGGLFGLLIGDAAGVPYEFKKPHKIPFDAPLSNLDVPLDYNRTYPRLKPGTWSDDGSQALCLLETLIEYNGYNREAFLTKLINWMDDGYFAVDNDRFDIGNQTADYLIAYKSGREIDNDRLGTRSGNGSLMRTLPVALFYDDRDSIKKIAEYQSSVTHPQYISTIACVLYCLVAQQLLNGSDKNQAWSDAVRDITHMYSQTEQQAALSIVLAGEYHEACGSGYVVDSLWSACYAFLRGTSYHEVIQYAIRLGNDTDTTACIAGGLAGIYYGYSGIPHTWIDALRDAHVATDLATKLFTFRGV